MFLLLILGDPPYTSMVLLMVDMVLDSLDTITKLRSAAEVATDRRLRGNAAVPLTSSGPSQPKFTAKRLVVPTVVTSTEDGPLPGRGPSSEENIKGERGFRDIKAGVMGWTSASACRPRRTLPLGTKPGVVPPSTTLVAVAKPTRSEPDWVTGRRTSPPHPESPPNIAAEDASGRSTDGVQAQILLFGNLECSSGSSSLPVASAPPPKARRERTERAAAACDAVAPVATAAPDNALRW